MLKEQDVTYAKVGDRELKLDLYRPEGGTVPTRTAVIVIHGGGWMIGERGMMAPLATQLAGKGFLAVAVEYRLVREAPWPAQIDDVVAATEWVAANAEKLGIDAGRIVLAGASAGGHLALMATAKLGGKARVGAVLSLFSASELTVAEHPAKGQFSGAALLGPNASEEALRSISPLHQVNADFPPVFLLHGAADWMIDPVASQRLYERLVQLGVKAELHIVADAIHEFIEEPGMTGPMVSEIALFLDRILIDPARWVEESKASNFFAQGPEAVMAAIKNLLAAG